MFKIINQLVSNHLFLVVTSFPTLKENLKSKLLEHSKNLKICYCAKISKVGVIFVCSNSPFV